MKKTIEVNKLIAEIERRQALAIDGSRKYKELNAIDLQKGSEMAWIELESLKNFLYDFIAK